jgi:hypothetical protein
MNELAKRLFTYTIPVDDGAAPNPFCGMCSLAICKPGIRRVARIGDWVAGLGAKNAPSGDLSGHVVYAMRIDQVLSLKEYYRQASTKWPHRIPNVQSTDLSERLGDCIYDYSGRSPTPSQRTGVHRASNRETDLSGENALISWDFYYFGNHAIKLPGDLLAVCHQTQGHRSDANAPYVDKFVRWIRALSLPRGMHGWPDYRIDWANISSSDACSIRRIEAENDRAC